MRALIVTQGSTGDIYPLIALATQLNADGDTATIATSPYFRKDIEAAGVGFLALPPDWEQAEFAEAMKNLGRINGALKQLRAIYESAKPYLVENIQLIDAAAREADVLVASYLFPYLQEVADRNGIPFAVTTFCHNVVPSEDYPPDTLPRFRWLPKPLRKVWNRMSWAMADRVLGSTINKTIHEELEACGLSKVKGFCTFPAQLALVTVSPSLMQPKAEIDPRFLFSGYLRHQPPTDDALEKELDAFCAGEAVPILTFGSVVNDSSRDQFAQFIATWPAGKKLIVQSGWAGFAPPLERREIRQLGKANHDQLFRYASCIIHHGGAGTTASALHAGKPQLLIPHIADQGFWAREIKRIGVGLSIPAAKWEWDLLPCLTKLEGNPQFAKRAKEAAEVLASEAGAKTAAVALRKLASNHKAS